MLDTIAYGLALATLVTLPPAILYWYLIHPLAPTWRRLGRMTTYLVVLGICVAAGYALWQVREPLLEVRYGFHPVLAAVGVVLYLIAVAIELQCRKHLKLYILVGAPELSSTNPGVLLDKGIYGRIRHPRYMSLMFGMTGVALFINYPTVYWLVAACVPLVFGLVLLEERELRVRFGEAYDDYSERVPRFIPRSLEA